MSLGNEIIEIAQQQLLEIPAQRLKEKLKPIISRQPEMTKRWFWELLQNASDYNQEVDVKLDVDDESLIFSHNGAPFKIKDVLNIISPNSNKSEEERGDTIGKFGSGLVISYLNAIAAHGIDSFFENYKYNLNVYATKIEIWLNEDFEKLKESDSDYSSKIRLLNVAKKNMKSVMSILFLVQMHLPLGIENERILDAYEKMQNLFL